jgi:glycosyltransferase involved in cell wall biosynthesis
VRISVILSTYNQPAWLEKVLWGYAFQTRRDFEIVVADDGSGASTAVALERAGREFGLDLLHVWHEDRGFRKCEILNRAVLAASGDYLIFSDGDCIPRRDFVDVHAQLAGPDHFLSGGYLKLPAELSARITLEDVRSGRFAELGWLRQNGWSPGRRAVRLLPSPRGAEMLDRLTPTRATWNGHNASTWHEAVLAVNGFDAEMKYGGEDRALGERLVHLGLRGVQIRHRAPVLHLDHVRPYVDEEVLRRNRAIRDRIAAGREVRARIGIEQIAALDEPVVTRRLGSM